MVFKLPARDESRLCSTAGAVMLPSPRHASECALGNASDNNDQTMMKHYMTFFLLTRTDLVSIGRDCGGACDSSGLRRGEGRCALLCVGVDDAGAKRFGGSGTRAHVCSCSPIGTRIRTRTDHYYYYYYDAFSSNFPRGTRPSAQSSSLWSL